MSKPFLAETDLPSPAPVCANGVVPASWTPAGRFGFRLAFCYFLLLVCTVTGIFSLLPFIGGPIESGIDWIWQQPVQWFGQHLFHLSGVAAHAHPADSRDTALDWIKMGAVALVALLAAAVWTLLDHRRLQYQTAAAWLRFVLRLTLVFLLSYYALMKIYPLQMPAPSLAVLNEPVGNTSPLVLLWTLLGLHPAYEILCGAVEGLCAVLLCFRRTALLGALLTSFVMTNVLLYNLFFDVPVKLRAVYMLLFALAIIAPDLRPLYQFYWRHQPAALTSFWAPPGKSRALLPGTRAFEIVFVALVLFQFVPRFSHEWSRDQAALRHPSPLTGEWRVDSALLTRNGRTMNTPVLNLEGAPMTAIFLEPNGLLMIRSADGKLWRSYAAMNFPAHILTLGSAFFNNGQFEVTYQMRQPDEAHLVLTPTGKEAATNGILSLTRIPLPSRYPLLEHGFHWVSEWGLWR